MADAAIEKNDAVPEVTSTEVAKDSPVPKTPLKGDNEAESLENNGNGKEENDSEADENGSDAEENGCGETPDEPPAENGEESNESVENEEESNQYVKNGVASDKVGSKRKTEETTYSPDKKIKVSDDKPAEAEEANA